MIRQLLTAALLCGLFIGVPRLWPDGETGTLKEESAEIAQVKAAHGEEKVRRILAYFRQYPTAPPQRMADWSTDALKILEQYPNEEAEIRLLGYLSAGLSRLGKPDESIANAKKGLEFAKRNGKPELKAYMYLRMGSSYFYASYFPKAQEYYLQSLEIYKKLGDTLNYYRLLCNIGNCHLRMGDRVAALEYLLQALKIAEKQDNSDAYANILNSLGVVYLESKDFKNAEKYFSLYMPVALKIGNADQVSAGYNNLGYAWMRRREYQRALHYFEKALEVKDAVGSTLNKGTSLLNIGDVHLNLKQPEKAAVYYEQAIRLCSESGEKISLAIGLISMAKVQMFLGRAKEMKMYMDRASALSKELNDPKYEANCRELDAYYLLMEGKHGDAVVASLYASDLKDQGYSDTINNRVAELQSVYQMEKKEQQIELLNKEKAIGDLALHKQAAIKTMLVGVVIVLTAFILLLINRYRLKNRAHREIEEKNRELTRAYRELAAANEEIKTLEGLLPICAVCKSIRDDQGYWRQVEVFIREHSGADFSHSICPACVEKLYPELGENSQDSPAPVSN